MEAKLGLVIDQGTHSTRAFAFDSIGQVVAMAQQPVALQRISADHIEQDAAEIAGSLQAVIKAVLADLGVRQRDITHAGLATQRSSVVAWDATTGAPLAPLLSWQDRRAADWLKQFAKREKQVKERTGLPLSPHYGASKMRWLLDNDQQVQQARRHGQLRIGPLASFLIFHLLRQQPYLVDHANAGRTQLWNIDSRDWDPGSGVVGIGDGKLISSK